MPRVDPPCYGQEVEASEFVSLESLASLVARIALRHAIRSDDVVTVRAAKPKALVFADAAEVEIVRTSRDYPPTPPSAEASARESHSLGLDPPVGPSILNLQVQNAVPDLPQGQHLAAIALGSNLGDRFANIEAALHLLEHPELIPTPPTAIARLTVINTSFLYETAPMYVTDQPSFLNCACIVCSSFLLYVAIPHSQLFRLELTLLPARSWKPSRLSNILWGAFLHFGTDPELSTWTFYSMTTHVLTPDPSPSKGHWKVSKVN